MKSIPLRRGVTEVLPIYKLASSFNGMLCGGYVRYMASPSLSPSPASDIDIFFKEESDFIGARDEIKKHLEVKHENEISVTFRQSSDGLLAYCPVIQIIKPKIEGAIVTQGSLEDILGNFDFTVVRVGMQSESLAIADDDFEDHETKKRLVIKNIHCPISSTLRCIKYAKKGYFLPVRETLKLFIDWQSRDETYRKRLSEMLAKEQSEGEMSQADIDELEALLWVD